MQLMRHARLTVTVLSAAAATFGLAAMPVEASASGATPGGAGPAAAGPQHGDGQARCPRPAPGYVQCQSIIKLTSRARNAPAAVSNAASHSGYGPGSLRSAYGLTKASPSRAQGRMVAIVDAYRNPKAASDLAHYRSFYHLGACTKANGCLHIVNQNGKTTHLPKLPPANQLGWIGETSLDLDMISAICPRCHITLVEASSSRLRDMGTAENTAARRARFVSNSWSGSEVKGEASLNHFFNHPGDAIVFASGDFGYAAGKSYPGDQQIVTSVGGTSLVHEKSGSRPWTETAWSGTQSGCSAVAAKPSWQHKAGDTCARRTQNDVAAEADENTPVAVYDSETDPAEGVWWLYGGTSVATPIVTATYALAGVPARRSYPSSYIYSHPKAFHDVTSGSDGTCATAYLCTGETGFDGPTGVGTPNGAFGLSASGVNPVTLLDPGAQTAHENKSFSLKITGLDQRAAAKSLSYTGGLPAGLHISGISGSTNGRITGTPTATGSFPVTVHAKDTRTGRSNTTTFTITVS